MRVTTWSSSDALSTRVVVVAGAVVVVAAGAVVVVAAGVGAVVVVVVTEVTTGTGITTTVASVVVAAILETVFDAVPDPVLGAVVTGVTSMARTEIDGVAVVVVTEVVATVVNGTALVVVGEVGGVVGVAGVNAGCCGDPDGTPGCGVSARSVGALIFGCLLEVEAFGFELTFFVRFGVVFFGDLRDGDFEADFFDGAAPAGVCCNMGVANETAETMSASPKSL